MIARLLDRVRRMDPAPVPEAEEALQGLSAPEAPIRKFAKYKFNTKKECVGRPVSEGRLLAVEVSLGRSIIINAPPPPPSLGVASGRHS